MMVGETIELHQTLHGYGDGHQLLSSSLQLTREQQWQLLVMSDLSGSSFRKGFDSYLTGYPLETGGFYCLARTWFAPELPRPGCVWTHTILISDTDVARIQDFRSIISQLRRPLSKEDAESYEEPVRAVPVANPTCRLDESVSRILLYLLYGSPSKRIILRSESSATYEEVILATLNQQWPRLRRSFRFCTGALEIRDRDVNFDVAVVPRDTRIPDADDTMATVTDPDEKTATERSEDWVRIALSDLVGAYSQTELRRFLWKFGPDYIDGRGSFRPLCEVYLASSRSSESIDPVLSAIAHFFPLPDSSKRLKAEFFGVRGSFRQPSQADDPQVLRALVTHPAAASIPDDIAAIEQRARTLVDSDERSASQIALTATKIGGSRAQQFLNGFAAGVRSKPGILHTLPSSLAIELLKIYPELLTSVELWKVPASQQLTIVAYIPSLPHAKDFAKKITEAVINANAWPALRSLIAQFGYEAVSAILAWIDLYPIESDLRPCLSIPDELFGVLNDQRRWLIETIRQKTLGPAALRVISAVSDPRADGVRSLGSKPWVQMIRGDVRLGSAESELHSKAFVLSIGLSLASEDAVQLVRDGFSAIYKAAWDNVLDDETWAFVEPYLPWYLVTWDKCARLIRGVVHLFVDRRWPANEFSSTFVTAEEFQRALEEASRTRRGSRYIKGICDQVRSGSLTIDKVRAGVLTRYC
jgi:hypothetical protein